MMAALSLRKELRVSIAAIGDWAGVSGSVFGYSMNPDIPDPGTDFGPRCRC